MGVVNVVGIITIGNDAPEMRTTEETEELLN